MSEPRTSSQSQQHCSICLEPIDDAAIRSTARLACGHHFHLDCIGSEFNYRRLMQCPNCRLIEDGNWLFAAGGFEYAIVDDDLDQEEEEDVGEDNDDDDEEYFDVRPAMEIYLRNRLQSQGTLLAHQHHGMDLRQGNLGHAGVHQDHGSMINSAQGQAAVRQAAHHTGPQGPRIHEWQGLFHSPVAPQLQRPVPVNRPAAPTADAAGLGPGFFFRRGDSEAPIDLNASIPDEEQGAQSPPDNASNDRDSPPRVMGQRIGDTLQRETSTGSIEEYDADTPYHFL